MPLKNSLVYFKNYYVYADFECFIRPVSSCESHSNKFFTMEYQKHEPSGFCLSLKQIDGIEEKINFDSFVCTKQSEDEDISTVFIESLNSITRQIYFNYYLHPERMRLTKRKSEKSFQRNIILSVSMDGAIYHEEYRASKTINKRF